MKTHLAAIISLVGFSAMAQGVPAATRPASSLFPGNNLLGENNTSLVNQNRNRLSDTRNQNNSGNNNAGSGGNVGTIVGTGNGQVGANNGNVSQPPGTIGFDRSFVRRAAADSLLEILLGQVARTNGQHGLVKQLGDRLVADHTASYVQAAALAESLGTAAPEQTLAQERLADRFAALSQARFDRVWINYIIQAHLRDIRLFESAALRGRNADVRAYARAQLPVLTEHLVLALEARELLATNP